MSSYSQESHYAVFAGVRLEALGQADTFGDRAAGTEEYTGPGEDDEQTVMAFGCVFIARPKVRGHFSCIFT